MPSGSPHLSAAPSAHAQMASYQNQQGGFIKVGLAEAPADVTDEATEAAMAAAAAADEAAVQPKRRNITTAKTMRPKTT
jgi:heterodisulfide reductase subunit A-like polyferredoxin